MAYGEVDKKVGLQFLAAENDELAEKIRGILSVLCGLRGEMVGKAHEHGLSRLWNAIHCAGRLTGQK
jgi:hypothetical protein